MSSPEFEAELEALRAVYGEDQVSFSADTRRLMIRVSNGPGSKTAVIRCEIPSDYPAASPPKSIDDPNVADAIEKLFQPGLEVMLQIVEYIRESLPPASEPPKSQSPVKPPTREPTPPQQHVPAPKPASAPVDRDLDPRVFIQGEPIVVNKSRFIGHAAVCRSPDEARSLLFQVNTSKHAKATHNMWAYRLEDGRADNEDDGEQAAGGRLAELLHVLQAKNVFVVVTRYYGGIQLGPQRFKLIAQSARSAIDALKASQAS